MSEIYISAASIVALANMSSVGQPLDEEDADLRVVAGNIERLAETGYYDDEAGAVLLKQIASYLRSKVDK